MALQKQDSALYENAHFRFGNYSDLTDIMGANELREFIKDKALDEKKALKQ
jgi:hypothetical protein